MEEINSFRDIHLGDLVETIIEIERPSSRNRDLLYSFPYKVMGFEAYKQPSKEINNNVWATKVLLSTADEYIMLGWHHLEFLTRKLNTWDITNMEVEG